jgi:hypothetical protein
VKALLVVVEALVPVLPSRVAVMALMMVVVEALVPMILSPVIVMSVGDGDSAPYRLR